MHTQQFPRVKGRHRRQTSKKANRLLSSFALGAMCPLAIAVGAGVAAISTPESGPESPPPAVAATPPTTTPGPPPTSTPAPTPTPVEARIERLPDPEPERKPQPKPEPKPAPKKKAPEPPKTQPPASDKGKGDSGAQQPPANPNWGTPDVVDEFNGDSVNGKLWSVYNGKGHAGNGRRTPDAITVANGILTITGSANGDSGGMAAKFDRTKYGRWEARVRSYETSSKGADSYHPVLIIWPDSGKRVQDGEYDWLENGAPGEKCAKAFMHYPGETPKKQEKFEHCGVDLSQWHVFGFEWTPAGLSGYVDGKQWFHTNNADIAEMPSGHMTIQLDNFHGTGLRPAKFEIDWVRFYKYKG